MNRNSEAYDKGLEPLSHLHGGDAAVANPLGIASEVFEARLISRGQRMTDTDAQASVLPASTDVLIAGAGPTGLVLANILASS